MDIVSLFSGCGGLDIGFKRASFNIIWANEYDSSIQSTYRRNHSGTILNTSDIRQLNPNDIPASDGIIGGPPCQPWSEAGRKLGFQDERGQVFLYYIRVLETKRPLFFLIENVPGMLSAKHKSSLDYIMEKLTSAGYNVYYNLLNAMHFGVPQDRERLFFVGIRNDITGVFRFPQAGGCALQTLQDAIGDIKIPPIACDGRVTIPPPLPNHHYYNGPYSPRYMARNRVRAWNEQSFTIPASASNVPLHPQAPKMIYINPERREFVKEKESLYRRLSVKECARIQTFPDDFEFIYDDIRDGYKMVGNAVPPKLAESIAIQIKAFFSNRQSTTRVKTLAGWFKSENQKSLILLNSLYYVRTGNRVGAMPIEECKNVKCVCIHNLNTVLAFKVVEPPFVAESSYLNSLGFNTSGDKYIVFKLGEEINIPQSLIIREVKYPTLLI